MKISGFTMVRNADKYYFPIRESILSILPIVDEFIVALGDNDPGDETREIIESIGSDKIRILDRVWAEEDFLNCSIFAKETNFALSQCTGDWCFYIQADEVVHEDDLPKIVAACRANLPRAEVDGLLFKYLHFYGDYEHFLPFHGWYKNEIRIVRNHRDIYSIKDAQSFRMSDNQKLRVVELDARIFHYGWVRPPELMQSKKKEQDSMYHGGSVMIEEFRRKPKEFDYGPLARLPIYKDTHPAVMDDMRKRIHWASKLNLSSQGRLNRPLLKHEMLKNRILSFFENTFNGGKEFFGYSNWKVKGVK